jgi:hypothetical protein
MPPFEMREIADDLRPEAGLRFVGHLRVGRQMFRPLGETDRRSIHVHLRDLVFSQSGTNIVIAK